MCQYIHFANNWNKNDKTHPRYNPSYKIRYVLHELMKGMKRAQTAGITATIDESMIKYCGQAIVFVQFMPAKPIKHGKKFLLSPVPILLSYLDLRFSLGARKMLINHMRKMQILLLLLFSNWSKAQILPSTKEEYSTPTIGTCQSDLQGKCLKITSGYSVASWLWLIKNTHWNGSAFCEAVKRCTL